ncbi:CCNO [Branchiostoma lanceolatum]|uniref:CCNO protein n=1 Tax=Branchiostoma lanceolatum TaxID=7740 RepID=A0A8K0EI81_BRALA|nr:CCNO [Branchiostoma lanceolatum]
MFSAAIAMKPSMNFQSRRGSDGETSDSDHCEDIYDVSPMHECTDAFTSVAAAPKWSVPDQMVVDSPVLASADPTYLNEWFLMMKSNEVKFHPVQSLNNQPQITPEMRGLLVRWLTQVCQTTRPRLLPETLFLAVNIVDRFLAVTPLGLDCLQLLGATALFIAAKMEEVHPLCAEEVVGLCDEGQYTRGQLRMLERRVLSTLGFHLTVPTSVLFLEHLAAHGQYDHLTSCLARHLLVTSLQDYVICQHAPSSLALAALNLAASLVNNTRMNTCPAVDRCILDLQLVLMTMIDRLPLPDLLMMCYQQYHQ